MSDKIKKSIAAPKHHGGARSGSGRKKGAVVTKTREIADRAIQEGLTPLEYMLQVLRDEGEDPERRFEAAKASAPYIHPRLAAIEHTGKDGGTIDHSLTVRFK